MSISSEPFGVLHNRNVTLYTLDNGRIQVSITDFGGTITRLLVPGQDGRPADIVLGYDRLEDYIYGRQYFGALIGRYANRIDRGRFQIDGCDYRLTRNEKCRHHLHGGEYGFHRRLWTSRPEEIDGDPSLVLELISPHGEEGYPGELQVKAVYTLTRDDLLILTLTAETTQPTIVNLTNHAYFNLAGHASETIHHHELMIDADAYTPIDQELIPTGEERPVDESSFDFRQLTILKTAFDHNRGPFDHNFVLNQSSDRTDQDQPAAVLRHPESGRTLKLYTNQPGLQFYTGQMIPDHSPGKSNTTYAPYSGLCLEPQVPPNSVNIPSFPSAMLRPGSVYDHVIRYGFSVG